MNSRSFIRVVFFVLLPIIITLGILFNIALYNECKKDGYSTIACYSMMNKGGYVIVDSVDGRP